MKERSFSGMLNSKSIYGQSYGDMESFRIYKLNRIYCLRQDGGLHHKWYKKGKNVYPSWSRRLWNFFGDITYSRRTENQGLKNKVFQICRWHKHWRKG